MDDGNTIRQKIVNPYTLERMNEVIIKRDDETLEYFRWNRYWRVYNSADDYSQLKQKDLENLYIRREI